MNLAAYLLIRLISLYIWIVIGSVILSWIDLPRDNPIVRFIRSAVDPVLEPLRGKLTFGGMDWSPLALILGLQLLQQMVAKTLLY